MRADHKDPRWLAANCDNGSAFEMACRSALTSLLSDIESLRSNSTMLPKQQPLTATRIDELIEEGVFGCNPYEIVRRLEEELGVFKTRPLTDDQIKYALKLKSCDGYRAIVRAIEVAHGIGGKA